MGRGKGLAPDRLYSEQDAAEVLGISVFDLRWLMSPKGAAANGSAPLPGITVGGRRMVRGRALRAWLDSAEAVRTAEDGDDG
ncbi:MAG: DNA-binding protein [Geminicoccaceae bacterium]|nr:MAG: DNA-binding protein [Geminicoccaceae bacterium]